MYLRRALIAILPGLLLSSIPYTSWAELAVAASAASRRAKRRKAFVFRYLERRQATDLQ